MVMARVSEKGGFLTRLRKRVSGWQKGECNVQADRAAAYQRSIRLAPERPIRSSVWLYILCVRQKAFEEVIPI